MWLSFAFVGLRADGMCWVHSKAGVSLNIDVWYNFFLTAGFGETAAAQHAATFKAHEMELDMVPDLTHDLLVQMGFQKAGPRIKIMRLREAILNPKSGESTYAKRR